MACRFVRGRTVIRAFPKTASVTFTAQDMTVVVSGTLATMTGTITTGVVGIAVKGVASTDGDYATAGALLPVEIPVDDNAIMQIDVVNGSLLTTSVGVRFGMSTAGAVDFADTTNTVVACSKFLSASLGEFQLKQLARWDNPN